jgi:hypothetical protein
MHLFSFSRLVSSCWIVVCTVIVASAEVPSVTVATYLEETSQTFGVTDGLPSNDVLAVAAYGPDSVYAGTAAGLAHFDGDRWEIVEGLQGAPVDRVVVDRQDERVVLVFRGSVFGVGENGTQPIAELPTDLSTPGTVRALASAGGRVLIGGARGLRARVGPGFVEETGFAEQVGGVTDVRDIAVAADGRVAVAAQAGLFLREGDAWRVLYPHDERRSWAPRDVRAVDFDSRGRLWFGSAQGAGSLDGQSWTLYEGRDGLPDNRFTCLTGAPAGAVWFGTERGAIRYDGPEWRYRQGRRWLANDSVRDLAVTPAGTAWFATKAGVSRIAFQESTLADKARYLEEEIDTRHRRTPYGYVLGVSLARPGDRTAWRQHDSDNDGLWTAMYGAGECFAFAATGDKTARERAKKAFEALRFLGTVTQGGTHPAPPGFVARTIRSTGGTNPNDGRLAQDRRQRAERDRSWKIIDPRWPVSEDGKWYWKSDTSSDELDGHYFLYGRYYDLVADTEEEKARVRQVVVALTDHLIEHEFNLVDHDGLPTRWGHFGPADLNNNPDWWEERGLNSLSMLSYLKVAEHVSGDPKYVRAARDLIDRHGYGLNIMYPKNQTGVGSGNHSDDEMAFMAYYSLLMYEKDPPLRKLYAKSFAGYWRLEYFERSPLFNFMYAAVASGDVWSDSWGEEELAPIGTWLEDSVRYLKRYPRDRIAWAYRNSHRLDVVPLRGYSARSGRGSQRGSLRDGKALPIDERFIEHWNRNPWQLDGGGSGNELADGASFLLPYYMGLYHGFIRETEK